MLENPVPAEIGDQTALRRGVVYLVTYVNRAKSLELHTLGASSEAWETVASVGRQGARGAKRARPRTWHHVEAMGADGAGEQTPHTGRHVAAGDEKRRLHAGGTMHALVEDHNSQGPKGDESLKRRGALPSALGL